jgi:hypothetical protein
MRPLAGWRSLFPVGMPSGTWRIACVKRTPFRWRACMSERGSGVTVRERGWQARDEVAPAHGVRFHDAVDALLCRQPLED